MPLPFTTLIGNLTADPELRFTATGKAVCSFTVACSERKLNRETDTWEDGDSIFIRCSAWEMVAESIAESCLRGTSVSVAGKLYQRQYETREGEKRYSFECRVQNFAVQIHGGQTVKVSKAQRATNDGGQGQAPPPDDPWGSAPAADPWGSSPGGEQQAGFTDEPPF